MTDSGSGAFENVSIIKAVLEETRNDVKLHSLLVERSTVYLQDIAVGGCAEEVMAGTATLTRILAPVARAVSERARPPASQCRRRRASRALVAVEDAHGGAGRHRFAFARSG